MDLSQRFRDIWRQGSGRGFTNTWTRTGSGKEKPEGSKEEGIVRCCGCINSIWKVLHRSMAFGKSQLLKLFGLVLFSERKIPLLIFLHVMS